MDSVARIILNNAQTVSDGGVIGDILTNVQLLNNSKAKEELMPYFLSTRMSGGYIAGLIFGLLWILLFILIMILLFYFHYKHQRNSPKKSLKNGSFERNRRLSFESSKLVNIFLAIFIIGMLLFSILLVCFYIGNIAHLQESIKQSPKSYKANSTQPNALLPAIKNSLFHIKHYLKEFAPEARKNTVPVVNEIIEATIHMQKDTQKHFNSILMRRIGVIDTFKYAELMTKVVLTLFDITNDVIHGKETYDNIMKEIFPKTTNSYFNFLQFKNSLSQQYNELTNCDLNCNNCKLFFEQKFSLIESFPKIEFATAFTYIMKNQNKTKQSVIAEAAHGKSQLDKQMAKTEALMKELMDIPGTIRNNTDETWDKMEEKMTETIALIEEIEAKLNSAEIESKASKYSIILSVVLLIPLIIVILVIVIIILVVGRNYCPQTFSNVKAKPISYSLYISFGLVCLVLFFAMILFLYGGKYETEVCRYLRTKQPIIRTKNGSSLVLDGHINKFLADVLPKIEASMKGKSEFPLPKPENVLYGIVHNCQKNEPILHAINAIKSLDTKGLSKPEISKKFTDIGRKLMELSLNETDPSKMMPKDMNKTLAQASQLNMFKNVDVPVELAKLPKSPIAGKDGKPISIQILLDKGNKCIKLLQNHEENKDARSQKRLQKLWEAANRFKKLLGDFLSIRSNIEAAFKKLPSVPNIAPIVKKLFDSLTAMVKLMKDKPRLLAIANKNFDEIILATTPQKAADIMAIYGPKMMGKLGYCRPIFLAYQSIIDTTCDVTISTLNGSWIYLGTMALLLSSLLVTLVNWSYGKSDGSSKDKVETLKMHESSTLVASKYADNLEHGDDKLESTTSNKNNGNTNDKNNDNTNDEDINEEKTELSTSQNPTV